MNLLQRPIIVAVVMIMTLFVSAGAASAADAYNNFEELAAAQTQDIDYKITADDRGTDVVVIAIHGGLIEPGTSDVAKELAARNGFSSYLFEGVKPANNSVLHITSSRFDEPIGRDLVSRSQSTISVHGAAGTDPVTYIGGLDQATLQKIRDNLTNAGFTVAEAPYAMGGSAAANIVNSNSAGRGVQLELSRALRNSFYTDGHTNETFELYVKAVSQALQ